MGKISMGRAIGDAYDLTFGRYRAVLGVVWLPIVLLAVGEYFALLPMLRTMPDLFRFAAEHPTGTEVPPEWERIKALSWAFNLAMLLVTVWIRVGVAKLALNRPRGPSFAYFFLGMDELRVIAGYIVYIALYIGAMIGITISVVVIVVIVVALNAGGTFAAVDPALLTHIAVGLAIAGMIAILCALFYFQTRLLFLLVPATIAEKRFGLWRSWELSEGNFWRIVVIEIGTLSPLLILEYVLLFAIYIPIIVVVLMAAQQHPEALKNPNMMPVIFSAALMREFIDFAPFAGVFGLLLAPFFCGLSYAPSAFAYRSISEKKDAA
jgi:hypothetical protein